MSLTTEHKIQALRLVAEDVRNFICRHRKAGKVEVIVALNLTMSDTYELRRKKVMDYIRASAPMSPEAKSMMTGLWYMERDRLAQSYLKVITERKAELDKVLEQVLEVGNLMWVDDKRFLSEAHEHLGVIAFHLLKINSLDDIDVAIIDGLNAP